MITITLKNNKSKVFNLPSFKRERELVGAWKVFKDDPNYMKKSFVFTSADHMKIKVRVPDIKDVFFDDIIDANAEPANKEEIKSKAREKLGDASDAILDTYYDLKKKAVDVVNEIHNKKGKL